MIQKAIGIESNPEVMDGLPVITGTRIPVYPILEMIEADMSLEGIRDEFPHLTTDQIRSVVSYAREITLH